MNPKLAKLKAYKQVIGVGLAALVLTLIFVPLQQADAFNAVISLPNATGNTATQNSQGEDFTVALTAGPNELFAITSISIIVDNSLSTVRLTNFNPNGSFASGDTGIIKNNAVTISSSASSYGYAYGSGIITSGFSFNAPYSYAYSASVGYLGGNTLGNSNPSASTNLVTGYLGPTTINISGKINTALLPPGTHTIDVFIDTSSGGNNVDTIVANQLIFTVNQSATVVQETVSAGTNVSLPPITVPGVTAPITVTISNVQTGGTIVVEEKPAATLLAETPGIFAAVGTSSTLTIGTSTGNTVGAILDIDISAITLGSGATIDVTIPYDPTLLPPGFNEANVKFFHWNGAAWQDVTLSVDTAANTVTGRLTSLSPVVAGYTSVAPQPGGNVPGGGGAATSGGGTGVDLTPTYPDSYFVNNPLAKVQLQSTAFKGQNGQNILAARTGAQLSIDTSFKNYQQSSQAYAIIIQVIDSSGFTADVGWVTGTLASGETAVASRSWVAADPDNYTVRIFVWDGISQVPTALSIVTDKPLSVVS